MTEASTAEAAAPRIRRLVAPILTLVAVGALAWYVYDRRAELEAAFDSSASDLVALFALCLVGTVINSSEFWVLYRSAGVPVGFVEQLNLYSAGQLANYLPFQVGTAYRLRYLKVVHGVAYAGGASFIAMNMLVTVASTAACGLVGVIGYAVVADGSLSWVLLAIFTALLVFSLAAALVPLPRSIASHPRIHRHWEEFHRGWETVRAQPRVGLLLLALDVIKLVVLALRFQVAFGMLGVEDSFFLFLVIGPVAGFTAAYAPTPGGLGIREAAVGGAAVAMGSSIPTGILAATVDRAVALTVTVVLGTIGSIATTRRMRGAASAVAST